MSSFLGAGDTYGFNLDFLKSLSSSSACSSTLSKSSSLTELSIPTKRARTPRKRPNQSYIEAATVLSTACPNVFSSKNLHKKYSGSLSSLSSSSLSSSEVPFPIFNEADFLIEEPPEPNPLKIRPLAPFEESCVAFREASPPGSPGYDVNSIFDDEAGEGIDSIMGKLSMNDCGFNSNSNVIPYIDPFVGSPMGLGLGGKLGVGQHGNNIPQALRGTQSEDWLRPAVMVQMQDIVPKFNGLLSLEKKKTMKKKKKVEEVKDEPEVIKTTIAIGITASPCKLLEEVKSGLGLKLNYEEVIKDWEDRGFPFSGDSGSLESSAEISARLAEIDLSLDNEGGRMREASVQMYLEKKKARHFSNNNKIRYKVSKVNADCKFRMKGRFVKKTHFLHQAIGEES